MARQFPSASGQACIRALMHLGFDVTRTSGLNVTVQKGARKVVVTLKPLVPPDEVALLLVAAGVTLADFSEALDRRTP